MRTALAICALALAGCEADLPPAYLVEDLRVLAVRAVEPEVLFDAPADATLTFEALVVDPRGGEVSYAWRFCPVESEIACADFDELVAAAPEAYRDVLAQTHAITSTGDAPTFVVDVPSALVAHHLETSLLGFGAGSWPSVVLEARVAGEAVTAEKRAVLNIRDLAAYAPQFAAELGVRICTDAESEDCTRVTPRTPNRNPELAGFDVIRDGNTEPLSTPLTLSAGAELRILPRFTEASVESYEVLRTDVNTRAIFVEAANEELSVQWFCSAGELAKEVTGPKRTKGFDNLYTAPDAPPATNGRASLWLVVRDGRGGTAWTQLDVEITP